MHIIRLISLSMLFTLLLIACSSSDNDDNDDNDNAANETQTTQVNIDFTARVGSETVNCGNNIYYYGIGSNLSTIQIADLRLYLYDIQLINTLGESIPLDLDQTAWQYENIALLDFEDATGLCNNGTSEINTTITGNIIEDDYTAIQFTLGVPYEYNHQDTAAAPSPLNLPSMFWSWQTGYKFLRLDMQTDREPRDESDSQYWYLHLGSTDCSSDSQDAAPITACNNTNVIENITLDNFIINNSTIIIDIASLLTNTDLSTSTPSPDGCMSGQDDPDCPSIFNSLGISLTSGNCLAENCSSQQLFYLE